MKTSKEVPIEGKVVHYWSNGTGRDTYITRTNGGLMSQSLQDALLQSKEEKPRMRYLTKASLNTNRYNSQVLPPKIEPKTLRYWGDGTGRDWFVIKNDGGLSTPYNWRNTTDGIFYSSLRKDDPKPAPRPLSSDPKQRKIQSAIVMNQQRKTNDLAQPKMIYQPDTHAFTPKIRCAHKLYKSYQTLKYQSKAR